MRERLAEQLFREAAATVDVVPAPVDAIIGQARAQRSRRRRLMVLVVVVVATLSALAVLTVTRLPDGDAELGPAAVERLENPSEVVWFANGLLHLADVTVALPPLQELIAVGGGAVYGDDRGAVVLVAADGTRERLGTTAPGAPLVASDASGWVAWVDPGDPDAPAPELVVHDLTSDSVLERLPLEEDSRPIAIDQATVFYAAPDGAFAWTPPDGEPGPITPSDLLDVSSSTLVWQLDPATVAVRARQPSSDVELVRPGQDARVSPRGDFVLTRTPDGDSAFGTVHIYDTRSGDEVPAGLAAGDIAVAAELGPEASVTYVVARAEDQPLAGDFVRSSFSGTLELRTCQLDTAECRVEAKFPSTGSMPQLAAPGR